MNERAGNVRNNLSGEMAYRSFVPSPLPPEPSIAPDDEMVKLLVKAGNQISLLSGIASRIPSVDLFHQSDHRNSKDRRSSFVVL